MPTQANLKDLPDLLTNETTAQTLSLSVSGLNKLRARDKQFPKPVRFGDSTSRAYFVRAEVAAYLAAKMAQRGEAA
ncbi:helix-turn-helix transcriptional regulator [Atopomonas sediminilitoris]|uniref:helix-turn-helix transcriptional regulator n=1 Tax=Atopomonas sediminilitoris TaxID=2919919 RepID=UPI001F4E63C6|nr:transcriptional regulator [Atopomonas sediminilitoris]MCJ8168724.1 transcriptional regulator [Atopomonas sediminilitoris]